MRRRQERRDGQAEACVGASARVTKWPSPTCCIRHVSARSTTWITSCPVGGARRRRVVEGQVAISPMPIRGRQRGRCVAAPYSASAPPACLARRPHTRRARGCTTSTSFSQKRSGESWPGGRPTCPGTRPCEEDTRGPGDALPLPQRCREAGCRWPGSPRPATRAAGGLVDNGDQRVEEIPSVPRLREMRTSSSPTWKRRTLASG